MRLCLTLALVAVLAVAALAKPWKPYEIVNNQPMAEALMGDMQQALVNDYGMALKHPVETHLVEAEVMDELLEESPYRGAEVGLYTGIENGRHQIYVMQEWSVDLYLGIAAHELTHAWQEENAPANQDQVVKEGFAQWIRFKVHDLTGAYQLAEDIRNLADPVYGTGFHAVLDLEQAVGNDAVVDVMRHAVNLEDLANVQTRH